MRAWFIGVGLMLVLPAACGPQSSSTATSQSTAPSTQTADARFLAAATMYENYQIQAAEIAAAQTQSLAVKTYAAKAASAHRTALQALIAAARSSGIATPDARLNQDYRAYIERLRADDPTPFDARYIAQQTLTTMSMAGRYDAFTSTAPESALKRWATSRSQAVHDDIQAAHRLAATAH